MGGGAHFEFAGWLEQRDVIAEGGLAKVIHRERD